MCSGLVTSKSDDNNDQKKNKLKKVSENKKGNLVNVHQTQREHVIAKNYLKSWAHNSAESCHFCVYQR